MKRRNREDLLIPHNLSSAVAHPHADTPPASQWRSVWDAAAPSYAFSNMTCSAQELLLCFSWGWKDYWQQGIWRNTWWNMNLISNPIRSWQFYRENVGNVLWLSTTTYCRRLSEYRICVWRMTFFSSFSPLTGGSFTSTYYWRVTARLAAPSEKILRVLHQSIFEFPFISLFWEQCSELIRVCTFWLCCLTFVNDFSSSLRCFL